MTITKAITPEYAKVSRQWVKRLNAQHLKTCAGFYPSSGCSRAFGARSQSGVLQITPDFGETWVAVDHETVIFRDHSGRQLFIKG